jgi:hypothetical protein
MKKNYHIRGFGIKLEWKYFKKDCRKNIYNTSFLEFCIDTCKKITEKAREEEIYFSLVSDGEEYYFILDERLPWEYTNSEIRFLHEYGICDVIYELFYELLDEKYKSDFIDYMQIIEIEGFHVLK